MTFKQMQTWHVQVYNNPNEADLSYHQEIQDLVWGSNWNRNIEEESGDSQTNLHPSHRSCSIARIQSLFIDYGTGTLLILYKFNPQANPSRKSGIE